MENKVANDSLSQRVDTVGQISKNRPCLSFDIKDSIEKIVREMHTNHQGAVGVTDALGRFVGLLTERDILRKIFGKENESQDAYDERYHKLSIYPDKLTAWDAMTPNPVCLYEDTKVEEALEEIKGYGFRFMPVVKRKNKDKLTGIVSERELFWHAQEKARRLLKRQSNLLSYFMHHESYGVSDDLPIKEDEVLSTTTVMKGEKR